MVKNIWQSLPVRFPSVELDDFVVMPNHLHGLLRIKPDEEGRTERDGRTQGSPLQGSPDGYTHPKGTEEGSLGRVVQAFKSLTTHEYVVGVKQNGWPAFDGKIWQRDYHDHIVRDEAALNNIRRYIADNPFRWEQDEENPHGPNVLR